METLKVGIVGAGFVAGFHCRAIMQVRTMEVAGITALQGAEALSAFEFLFQSDPSHLPDALDK